MSAAQEPDEFWPALVWEFKQMRSDLSDPVTPKGWPEPGWRMNTTTMNVNNKCYDHLTHFQTRRQEPCNRKRLSWCRSYDSDCAKCMMGASYNCWRSNSWWKGLPYAWDTEAVKRMEETNQGEIKRVYKGFNKELAICLKNDVKAKCNYGNMNKCRRCYHDGTDYVAKERVWAPYDWLTVR